LLAPHEASSAATPAMAKRGIERASVIATTELFRCQHRLDDLAERFDRRCLRQALAVDEERRRGADAERIAGARSPGRDLIEQLLIGKALVEAFLRKAGLLGNVEQL